MQHLAKIVVAAATVAGLAACAAEPSPAVRTASQSFPHAAEIWADKCGACHVPVGPGERPRAVIEAAMDRHRRRTRLTESEWRELVDFLSHDHSQTAQNHH